jgi:hypothetical protein
METEEVRKIESPEEARQIEETELNILLDKGISFDIELKQTVGIFHKKTISKTETFVIKKLTLGTMDRMSKYFLQINIDENNLSDNASIISEAIRLIPKNAKNLSKIIALAVVGDNYYSIEKGIFKKRRYKRNKKRVRELSRLFYETVSPSLLVNITNIIIGMCDMGNFLGSMRLMSASRTTAPRIEKKA